MKKLQLMSAVSSIEEVSTGDSKNPFLTIIKFIFADNKPNANKQGIEEEDFDEIVQSSVHMPIKMLLAHGSIGGHDFSLPIGHIISMEKEKLDDETVRLAASAVLYKQEFPEEVKFLKDKFEEGEPPGISWEVAYRDSVLRDGVEWLKSVITTAATFVKHPAYGTRTALLAIASNAEIDNNAELMQFLKEIVDKWETAQATPKGGRENMDELEKAQKDLAEALAKITALEADVADRDTKLSEATTKITTLEEENGKLVSAAKAEERVRKYVEAGLTIDEDAEKAAKKKEFWLSMSDESFDTYLEELLAVKGTKPATASRRSDLPRLAAAENLNLADMKSELRRISRGNSEE